MPVVERALADAGADAGRPRRGGGDRGAGADRRAAGRAGQRPRRIAFARGLPLIPVDHLHGHIAASTCSREPLEPPFLALLASGGHTLLAEVDDRARLPGDRHDAGRRRRRGVRQGRPSARPRLPGRRGARAAGGAAATQSAHRFPVADARPARPRLLVQRPQDGAAVRRPRRGRTAPRRPGRVLPAGDRPVAGRADDGGGGRHRPRTPWPSSAGWPATARCARRSRDACAEPGVRLALAPPALCSDNAAMIASAARFTRRRSRIPDYLDRDAYASRVA